MSWGVYIGVTVFIAGGAAYMMGQSLAATWRPLWQVFIYAILLGLADRFIVFALFEGELLSITGFMLDSATVLIISLLAYRITQVHKMVNQYPWLYQRQSIFHWREMDSTETETEVR